MQDTSTYYDFRSDTVTQPSKAMKIAMMDAEVGDDVYLEDPTTTRLQEEMAQMAGKQAGLLFPTGCMANLAALMAHAEPGKVLFAGNNAHIVLFELGSYARIAGLNLLPVDDRNGYLDRDALASLMPPDVYYMPKPGVIAVENSQNILGGLIYPVTELKQLHQFAQDHKLPLHMDGARLFHAAAAEDALITHWTRHVDSVMISLSKGLGCPVGSILLGSNTFIDRARTIRKLLGGGMRQTGILAAAGLHALDNNIHLLKRDNQHAVQVYEALSKLDWIKVREPETNILIIHTEKPVAAQLTNAMLERGIKISAFGPNKIRVIFHLGLAQDAPLRLIEAFKRWGQKH